MPGSLRRDEYSSVTGTIFLFNLIVGTGALALPGALQDAGWVMGLFLIMVLALFSFITVTFVVEALAVSNALSRKRYEGLDRENENLIEQTPLVPRSDNQDMNVFEITEKYELGQMGLLVAPKWCQVIIYLCLCIYLYGDMAIYILVIGQTFTHVICTDKDSSFEPDAICLAGYSMTKINIYRLSAFAFVCIMGPFVFFNLQKTKFLQIFTGFLRWLAFFIMLVWSSTKLVNDGAKGHPSAAEFSALPTLFGTLVYSFMCQHSIPGLLQPISNKKKLNAIITTDYILIVIFYISLSLTAIFTFSKIEDIYTINFWRETLEPGSSVYLKILSYYLALFPVFTLSTSFPIIGITLRNNLRYMILKDTPHRWYTDRLLFPLVTIIPPTALALATYDLHLMVGVIGSYAGAGIQYLIPCFLVYYARSQAKQFNSPNIHASFFKSNWWIYLVHAWMIVCLILITVNFALKIKV